MPDALLDYLNAFDWLRCLIKTLRLISELGFRPEPTQQREREMRNGIHVRNYSSEHFHSLVFLPGGVEREKERERDGGGERKFLAKTLYFLTQVCSALSFESLTSGASLFTFHFKYSVRSFI